MLEKLGALFNLIPPSWDPYIKEVGVAAVMVLVVIGLIDLGKYLKRWRARKKQKILRFIMYSPAVRKKRFDED